MSYGATAPPHLPQCALGSPSRLRHLCDLLTGDRERLLSVSSRNINVPLGVHGRKGAHLKYLPRKLLRGSTLAIKNGHL